MPRTRIPHSDDTKLAMAFNAGTPMKVLAAKYGVHPASIWQRLEKLGVFRDRHNHYRQCCVTRPSSITRPVMRVTQHKFVKPDNYRQLTARTGQPHRAPLRLPPIGAR